ncbi:hypothetical protein [Streptomyces sp. NBC_01451]|uniref:hypothetical protein n=1 Tax=Streptomyces sp. NBC_01451 TaxID=2903872 RepID=UPI002E304C7C|nr:hypothetical protein [Streptomyces sp. NBC_01451]
MNRAILAGALALASAGTYVALAPAASAAAQACVTSHLTTATYEGTGTIVTKSSTSTCSDLNLTYAYNANSRNYDYYAGRLYHSSGGYWQTCDAGYIKVTDGSYAVDKILPCTSVGDGVKFTVASLLEGGDTVWITH